MLKQKLLLLCALSYIGSMQAGTVGEEVSEPLSNSSIFIAAEGGWTWNSLGGLQVNILEVGSIFTTKEVSRGSARVSLGARKFLCDNYAAIGEIGYGYYGKTNFNFNQTGPILSLPEAPDFSNIHVKVTNDGFDVLGGLSYNTPLVEVFFKAGAMIENSRYEPTVNLAGVSNNAIAGGVFIDFNKTQVFPEIKLGAGYQVYKNLSVTAAWMHVFGETPHITADINPNMPLGTIVINRQDPRLDTFFLGAAYDFPV